MSLNPCTVMTIPFTEKKHKYLVAPKLSTTFVLNTITLNNRTLVRKNKLYNYRQFFITRQSFEATVTRLFI